MMMMMMMMMELGSFSYLGTLLVTSYYCRYLCMYVLQSEPVPDATAQSRFTDEQTRQTRQVPSRPGPTSTCNNCTCACTCTCYLYLSQSSRSPLVCDAEQSAFLTEYDMVGVSYLKLKLPPTCQYVPSDFVYYTRTRLPSKQASNRFFCCHQSASTGLVSMYCLYVQDMCMCV